MAKNRPEIVPVDFTPPEGMVFFRTLASSTPIPPSVEEAEAAALAGEAVTPSEFAKRKLEMQVLPLGKLTTVDGRPLAVDAVDLQIVMLDLSQRQNEVAILYEHGVGPRGGLAAGWQTGFSPVCRTDKARAGLFAVPEYTATATKEIRAKEWRYVSPGFYGVWDEEGFLHPRILVESSLTNVPAIDGMLPLAASVRQGVESRSRADVPTTALPEGVTDMDETAVKALIAEAVKPVEARATKLETENVELRATVTAQAERLAKVPDDTRAAVESAATQRANEQLLGTLTTRAKKVGLTTDDTKDEFSKLAKADPAAMLKMIERAEAIARAPRGHLFRPDTPTQAQSTEPPPAREGADGTILHEETSSRLTAAIRRARETGRKAQQTIREVSNG